MLKLKALWCSTILVFPSRHVTTSQKTQTCFCGTTPCQQVNSYKVYSLCTYIQSRYHNLWITRDKPSLNVRGSITRCHWWSLQNQLRWNNLILRISSRCFRYHLKREVLCFSLHTEHVDSTNTYFVLNSWHQLKQNHMSLITDIRGTTTSYKAHKVEYNRLPSCLATYCTWVSHKELRVYCSWSTKTRNSITDSIKIKQKA